MVIKESRIEKYFELKVIYLNFLFKVEKLIYYFLK